MFLINSIKHNRPIHKVKFINTFCRLCLDLVFIDKISMGDFMKIDYNAIGNRIKERRLELGMSQEAVAEKAEMSTVHLGNIENAKTKLSVEILIKLCYALDVTPDYLLVGSNRSIDENYRKKFSDMLTLCKKEDLGTIMDILAAFTKR